MTNGLHNMLQSRLSADLVDELLRQHARAHQRFQAGEAEGALEAVGKYAEAAIRCADYLVTGCCVPLSDGLPPFDQMVRRIESTPSGSAPESMRVIAPRVLHAMYTVRSKRGGGHVSGEVTAERIDAMTCQQMADWFLAELVRVIANLPLDEGQALVDSLVQRQIPVLYHDEHVRVVTRTDLELDEEMLVLLYSEPSGLSEAELMRSTRRSRGSVRHAIDGLIKLRHAYKTSDRPYRVRLLPPGVRRVEHAGLLSYPPSSHG